MDKGLLERLRSASSPDEGEWIVLEHSLSVLAPELQNAVWAAAIPHWFNSTFLSYLLNCSSRKAQTLYSKLLKLSFVEIFENYGHNLHERTRSTLLKHLWQYAQDRFKTISQRAAAYCQLHYENDRIWYFEMIYHQLMVEPENNLHILKNAGQDLYEKSAIDQLETLIRLVAEHYRNGRLTKITSQWLGFFEGLVAMSFTRYQEALNHFITIVESVQNDPDLIAECNFHLGTLFIILSKYDDAKLCLERSLTNYKQIGDSFNEAKSTQRLGDAHLALREYKASIQCFDHALRICQNISDQVGSANSMKSLGDVYVGLGQNITARQYFEEALQLFTKIGDKSREANCVRCIGDVEYILRQYRQAMIRYSHAKDIYRKIGDNINEAYCQDRLQAINESILENLPSVTSGNQDLASAPPRTNEQLLDDLQGKKGSYRQQTAFQDLANVLHVTAYNYLLQRQYAISYLSNLAPDELNSMSKDFVQDVLQKLSSNQFSLLASYKNDGKFINWCRHITTNIIANELRHPAWRRRENVAKAIGSEIISDPERHFFITQAMSIISNCFERLPERQRIAFEKSVFEGLFATEIAQILNTQEHAVHQLIYRARASLRQCILERGVNRDDLELFL